jgi:hypothetical protein
MIVTPVGVLAVDDARLVRMQFQPDRRRLPGPPSRTGLTHESQATPAAALSRNGVEALVHHLIDVDRNRILDLAQYGHWWISGVCHERTVNRLSVLQGSLHCRSNAVSIR